MNIINCCKIQGQNMRNLQMAHSRNSVHYGLNSQNINQTRRFHEKKNKPLINLSKLQRLKASQNALNMTQNLPQNVRKSQNTFIQNKEENNNIYQIKIMEPVVPVMDYTNARQITSIKSIPARQPVIYHPQSYYPATQHHSLNPSVPTSYRYPYSAKTLGQSPSIKLLTQTEFTQNTAKQNYLSKPPTTAISSKSINSINTSIKKIEDLEHKDTESICDEELEDEQSSFVFESGGKLMVSHLVSTTEKFQQSTGYNHPNQMHKHQKFQMPPNANSYIFN